MAELTDPRAPTAASSESGDPLVVVRDLSKDFTRSTAWWRRRRTSVSALCSVDLEVQAGEWLALVGESGSGKSTLARIIANLESPSSGSVLVGGQDPALLTRQQRKSFCRRVQFVYQDAVGALNPRMSVFDLIAEPLRIHTLTSTTQETAATVERLLADVGLEPDLATKRPGQISGGQIQRVNLARALALDPDLLLLDEPTSALDVSVQAQIIELLRSIQRARQLTVLMISHDLALVSQTCERVAVMYYGVIVETGRTQDVIARPSHPYTERLLQAVPDIDDHPDEQPEAVEATEPPDPENPPSGCRFRTRCDRADETCSQVRPDRQPIGQGRDVACHHPLTPSTVDPSKEGPL